MKIKILAVLGVTSFIGLLVCLRAQTTEAVSIHRQWVASRDHPYSLQPGANGRYQVITASIDDVNNPPHGDELVPDKTVIRIDTETGQTWRLVNLGDESTGDPKLSWQPLSEGALVEK
jgi:hypothetical protein